MNEYDLVVRGGTVVTGIGTFRGDVGIRQGRIAALGERLEGTNTLDAGGLLVLPGGVDSHCHIEQLRAQGGGIRARRIELQRPKLVRRGQSISRRWLASILAV